MNKKIFFYLIIAGILIFSTIIDYTNYNINESDIEHVVKEILNNITYPENAEYIIEDKYEKGRILFYSGQVFNEENKGPFIIGFRKHWLLSKYTNENHLLRLKSRFITKYRKIILNKEVD